MRGLAFFLLSLCASAVVAQEAMKLQWDTTSLAEQIQFAKQLTIAGKTDRAELIYRQTYSQSKSLAYNYGIVKSQIGLGNIAINRGDHTKSLQQYRLALRSAQNSHQKGLLTTIHNNIGNVHLLQGDYALAAQQYEAALNAYIERGSELHLETIYNNLSICLIKIGQIERALSYLSKAEARALEANNQITLADIYNNIGTAYNSLCNTEKSNYYFNQSAHIARQNNYINTLFSALVNLAVNYQNSDKLAEALAVLNEADRLPVQSGNYYKNLFLLTQAAVRLKMKDFPAAEDYLLKSLQLAEQQANIKDIQTTHMLLSELYQKTNRWEQALHHKQMELALLDSVKSEEAMRMVTEMESKYQLALKDEHLAQKTATLANQKQALATKDKWLYIGCSGLLLIIIITFVQRRSFLQKQKIKNEQLLNLEHAQKNMQLQAIMDGAEQEKTRLSREIHDNLMVRFSVVKMNLSTILHKTDSEESKEQLKPVIQQLDRATDQLRHIAHNLMPDRISEDGLVEALQYFCDSIRASSPLNITCLTIGQIKTLPQKTELSIYRIIQELVQNILKHAEATEAIVQLSYLDDYLNITVEDNGRGIAAQSKNNGLGLKSIAARLNELKGKMNIESSEGIGTTVQLEIHLESKRIINA